MTNYEVFKKDIELFNHEVALVKGVLKQCNSFNCKQCEWAHEISCERAFVDWLFLEYKEPVDWTTVTTDTDILVSEDGKNWLKRHFAKYEHGRVYFWIAGKTSWTADNNDNYEASMFYRYAKLADNK